jgi:hypothetical protein
MYFHYDQSIDKDTDVQKRGITSSRSQRQEAREPGFEPNQLVILLYWVLSLYFTLVTVFQD